MSIGQIDVIDIISSDRVTGRNNGERVYYFVVGAVALVGAVLVSRLMTTLTFYHVPRSERVHHTDFLVMPTFR
jgi:hypothetical protein